MTAAANTATSAVILLLMLSLWQVPAIVAHWLQPAARDIRLLLLPLPMHAHLQIPLSCGGTPAACTAVLAA